MVLTEEGPGMVIQTTGISLEDIVGQTKPKGMFVLELYSWPYIYQIIPSPKSHILPLSVLSFGPLLLFVIILRTSSTGETLN